MVWGHFFSRPYRENIARILRKCQFCGDFNWLRHISRAGITLIAMLASVADIFGQFFFRGFRVVCVIFRQFFRLLLSFLQLENGKFSSISRNYHSFPQFSHFSGLFLGKIAHFSAFSSGKLHSFQPLSLEIFVSTRTLSCLARTFANIFPRKSSFYCSTRVLITFLAFYRFS